MHYWGDNWFKKNGKDLNAAIEFIASNLHHYGRMQTSSKEKYGTVRCDVWFSNNRLIRFLQEWVYKTIYLIALKKWPHLREEILSEADRKELFPIDIQREANKNWSRPAAPGELVYPLSYLWNRAVVGEKGKNLIFQGPNGHLYYGLKSPYRHWDGCGIS